MCQRGTNRAARDHHGAHLQPSQRPMTTAVVASQINTPMIAAKMASTRGASSGTSLRVVEAGAMAAGASGTKRVAASSAAGWAERAASSRGVLGDRSTGWGDNPMQVARARWTVASGGDGGAGAPEGVGGGAMPTMVFWGFTVMAAGQLQQQGRAQSGRNHADAPVACDGIAAAGAAWSRTVRWRCRFGWTSRPNHRSRAALTSVAARRVRRVPVQCGSFLPRSGRRRTQRTGLLETK